MEWTSCRRWRSYRQTSATTYSTTWEDESMDLTINALPCPKCGCGECSTKTAYLDRETGKWVRHGEERLLIRGYKQLLTRSPLVDGEWQSCCHVCSGYYWKQRTGYCVNPDAEENYKEHGHYAKGVPMYWFSDSDSTKHRLSPPTAPKRDIWS